MDRLVKIFLTVFAAVVVGHLFANFINYKLDNLKNDPKTPVKYVTMADREKQLECLARNIYHEAARESFEGKVAVAQVTINRARSQHFPNDICKVVYQKNVIMEKVICQFSWYCTHVAKKKVLYPEAYEECYAVAKKVLLEGFRLDILKDALYYHANYVNPKWKKQRVATIGNHIFYK